MIDGQTQDVDLEAYLTVLGHVGFTAYTGLVHIGEVRPDDIVYVSGAAGGVGSCVVQFGKARGATVIGVAGSSDKVALLTDVLGADRAVNRHDGPAVDLLRDAAPEGIDLYYDNVGGEQLEAALEVLRFGGRAVICGAVAAGSGGPANYRRMIYQELTMRGLTVTAHEDLRAQFESEVGRWVREGAVRSLHTVFDGIDRVPEAFASLLAGGSSGRVIVAING
ncbi:MDR family NADP-dependent oxidoreductase [Brachybacterium avium]|uniref:MDR family NADP-dependent oxidoreductase n=1 Tax=Brachybacterium avium TaxID=2017485 RepID=UPI0015618154|nr:NADP-dependent oxidoreductase [Brachybacterium avium]